MKKLLLIVLAICFVGYIGISFVVGKSNGISWLSSNISSEGTIKSKTYSLEMEGFDGRAYVFKPPNSEDKNCLAVATSEGVGVTCY